MADEIMLSRENKENIEALEKEVLEIKDKIEENKRIQEDFISKIGEKEYEDIPVDYIRKIYKANIGLPVFTSVPTYTGFQGEHVWLNDGTNYMLYAYISGGWRKVGSDEFGISEFDFGDGSTGDDTISVNETLTEDKFYDNLIVDAGKVLTTAGYRVYVKGTLTNNGTISWKGNNGVDAVATSGAGGVALADANLGGSGAGGEGRGGVGENGASVNPGLGGAGGDGGGDAGPPTLGGSGGSVTAPTCGLRAFPFYLMMTDFPTTTIIKGGAGGGGGGGDDYSGGGGSGGGVMVIAANVIVNNSSITVAGGDGGDAGSGGGTNSGGGGGGGGGAMILIYSSKSGAGTESVAGGTKGVKNGANATEAEDGVIGTKLEIEV